MYNGYPEQLYEEEIYFPIRLDSTQKWGLVYAAVKVNNIVVIGEVNKWAHVSPQVPSQVLF